MMARSSQLQNARQRQHAHLAILQTTGSRGNLRVAPNFEHESAQKHVMRNKYHIYARGSVISLLLINPPPEPNDKLGDTLV